MAIYTPPALNAVNFALEVQPAHSVVPYDMPLSVYSVPTLSAVDFALVAYTPPVYNTIDFEFLPVVGGTTGQIKWYNGSTWEAKPVKVWNGASWVIKPVKYYNGTIWVETTY